MKKFLIIISGLLLAFPSFAQTGKLGVGTTMPLIRLDVVGDTIGLRNTSGWDNLWITVDGSTANINASGAENGLNFKVGSNGFGTYGDGQALNTVMTMMPNGNVGVGTTQPNGTALMDMQSTNKGILIPRITTTQRTNITTASKGLMVYDSTVNAFYYYNGTTWAQVGDNLGNHTATQTINLSGYNISNNGTGSGLTLDNSGNEILTGKVTATGATLSGSSSGNAYDYLMKSNAAGDVGSRRGFGALGLNYIIATAGTYPTSGGSSGLYGVTLVGEIKLVAFVGGSALPPTGWALCNGQLLPINQYTSLFALLGTTYGGNGNSNFALPDLRGAVPVGAGTPTAGNAWTAGQLVH